MKSFFSKASVLKVVSLIVAIVMWFYIIIVVNPPVDVTIRDIPVQYVNTSILSDNGLCVINEKKPTVTIKIRGSRKNIANIDKKNVYATVDLSNVTKKGTVYLPIELSIPYEYNEIVNKKPYNAEIIIDDIAEKNVQINIVTSGSVANGYIAGPTVTSDDMVKLRGASSLLEQIGSAAVAFDYKDRKSLINDRAKIYLIDKEGHTIEENSYIYEIIEMNITETQIICPIFRMKTVPIKVNQAVGIDNGEYTVSITPPSIMIYGKTEELDKTDAIYTESFNVSSVLSEGAKRVTLNIPQGITVRDDTTEVLVEIKPKEQ